MSQLDTFWYVDIFTYVSEDIDGDTCDIVYTYGPYNTFEEAEQACSQLCDGCGLRAVAKYYCQDVLRVTHEEDGRQITQEVPYFWYADVLTYPAEDKDKDDPDTVVHCFGPYRTLEEADKECAKFDGDFICESGCCSLFGVVSYYSSSDVDETQNYPCGSVYEGVFSRIL